MRLQRGGGGRGGGRDQQPPGLTMALALAVAVLISFWPVGSLAASAVDCPDWQSPSECNTNSNGNNNNGGNNENNKIGNNNESDFINGSMMLPDNLLDMDLERDGGDNWPLERIVSIIVPVFFGIIGFAGLLGNALVILGKSLSLSLSLSLSPLRAGRV